MILFGVNDLRRDLYEARFVLALSFGILIVVFWRPLAEFIPTADNEVLPGEIIDVVLQQGRLFSYLLLLALAPARNIHNLDFLVAIGTFALSITVFVKTLGDQVKYEHYVAAAVAAAFPTTLHMFTFSTVNMIFGIAELLVALSVYFYARRQFLLFCTLMVVAIGMYQGVVLNAVVIYLFAATLRTFRNAATIKGLATDAFVFLWLLALSALAYTALMQATFSSVGLRQTYFQQVVRFDLLIDQFVPITTTAFQFAFATLTGKDPLFLDRGPIIGAFQILLLLLAVANCVSLGSTNSKRALAVILLIGATGAPFLSIALTGGGVRYRFLLAAPFSVGGLAFVAAMFRPKWLQHAIAAATFLGVFHYVQTSTQMTLGASLGWQADRELSQRILERIAAIDPAPLGQSEKRPFEMVGVRGHNSPWIPTIIGSTIGYSFYRYSESPARVTRAFSILGYPDYRPVTNAERLAISDKVVQMPVWPTPGSVAVVDGIVVVKLMPRYTNFQISQYCTRMPKSQCADLLSRQ